MSARVDAMLQHVIDLELEIQIAQGEIEYWRARIAIIDDHITQHLMEIETYDD